MNAEGITAFVTAVYAVRWILAVLVVIMLCGLVGAANHRADQAAAGARKAEAEAKDLRRRLDRVRTALQNRSEVRRG